MSDEPDALVSTAPAERSGDAIVEGSTPADVAPNRRETLAAIGKLATFVAPMSVVLLSAEQAKGHHVNCSLRPEHSHCN